MTTSETLLERRQAAIDAADAVRRAIAALAITEAPAEQLRATAAAIRDAVAGLKAATRAPNEVSALDDVTRGARFFSPAAGPGNPMAPELVFEPTPSGMRAVCTLDRRFEGPPGFVHGGISALLFDELLGTTMAASGRWGMTGSLAVSYRRALPLDTELIMHAAVTSTDGRKTWIEGSIGVASQPEVTFVTATALFIQPRESTREAYFGDLVLPAGQPSVPTYQAGNNSIR